MPENLALTIEKAFTSVARPPDNALCISYGDEELEDTEPFRGKNWMDVDQAALELHYSALFWFTPAAFHYYLPAFLRAGLASPKAVFVVTILQLLEPTDDRTLSNFRRERWTLLNDLQQSVLQEWLHALLAQAKAGSVLAEELTSALEVVRSRLWR